MASYVVMEPARRGGEADAESILLVRDGFSLFAFFLPALWLVWHRLWIEAAFAFAATVGLVALANLAGFGVTVAIALLVSLFAGLEGAALRIAALRRRGWREFGIIESDSEDDAETRYFLENCASPDTKLAPVMTASAQAATRRAASDPAVGLLLDPGRA
jgi:hypothetical protein